MKTGWTERIHMYARWIVQLKYRLFALLVLGVIFSLQACREDDEPATGDTYVNNWIYDNMSFWYYWNDQLPDKPDRNQEPEDFFTSLLSTEDRFSAIYDDYEEILNALEGVSKEAGYEFVLYRESESNSNVIAQVLYIKKDSPAEATELKRGDIITHVNGQQLTLDNYQSLINQLSENHSITYRPMTATSSSSGTLGDPVTLNLTTVVLQEDPNFYSEVIDVDGTRKAGYLMYTFFASGIGEGIEYNNEMDQIIANFKAQGITDLIVDLRYNSGGYVDAAINLASLIGKNIDEFKVFFRREYNSTVTDYFNITETDEVVRFIAKAQNVGNSLSGNLYVLTGTETASASELVINGLRPFMPVKLIGEVTYGKNVGSIPVYEEDNPANRWLMLPIVMKSFNSNGQSDYSNGFIPDLEVDEGIYLLPIGDREEPLLSAALAQIAGGPGRLALPSIRKVFGQRLGSSFDMKNKSMRRIILEKKPQTVFH